MIGHGFTLFSVTSFSWPARRQLPFHGEKLNWIDLCWPSPFATNAPVRREMTFVEDFSRAEMRSGRGGGKARRSMHFASKRWGKPAAAEGR